MDRSLDISQLFCFNYTQLLDGSICFDFSQQLKTEQISVQLPDDCPSDMKQVVAII